MQEQDKGVDGLATTACKEILLILTLILTDEDIIAEQCDGEENIQGGKEDAYFGVVVLIEIELLRYLSVWEKWERYLSR